MATGHNNHTRPPQTATHSVIPIKPLVKRPLQPLRRTSRTSGPKCWVPLHAVTSRRGPISSKPGGMTRSNVRQRSSSLSTVPSFPPFIRRSEKHLTRATSSFVRADDAPFFQQVDQAGGTGIADAQTPLQERNRSTPLRAHDLDCLFQQVVFLSAQRSGFTGRFDLRP